MADRADLKRRPITITLLGPGTVVVGDVVFSGGMRVDGEVRGNMCAEDGHAATLVVGERGRVDGDIDVTNVVIHGSVTGRVLAADLVELGPTALVSCAVEYSAIEMHLGAVILGQLLYRPNGMEVNKPRSVAARRRGG